MSGNDCILFIGEGQEQGTRMREQACETSRGNDQIFDFELGNVDPVDEKVVAHVANSVKKKFKALDDALIEEKADYQEGTTTVTIPKVPAVLCGKDELKEYFKPRVVSIGPYHHKNQDLKVNENVKLKLAAIFIREHFANDKEKLYSIIKSEIKGLRDCYEPEATKCYDDDYLALMFLIDGCAVLHFIYAYKKYQCSNYREKSKELQIVEDVTDRYTFGMDLLLLENQLPYKLLEQIISAHKECHEVELFQDDHKQWETMLAESIQLFIDRKTYIELEENIQKLPLEKSLQLLNLLRMSFTLQSVSRTSKKSKVRLLEKSINFIARVFVNLGSLVPMLLDIQPRSRKYIVLPFHTFEELKEAGIELKPNTTDRLTDISFNRGKLKLPRINITHSTPFMFLNLIAYEMVCQKLSIEDDEIFKVSSYLFFLASFIAGAQDVKELRINKILFSRLDNDEDTAKLFKVIGSISRLVPHYGHYSILDQIKEHYGKKYNNWVAQLKNKYFESPWRVIAFVGAVIALLSSVLQTFYTIYFGYHTEK